MKCNKNNRISTLLGKINKSYVYISNRMTEAYRAKYSFPCDLYFPIYKQNPIENGEYPTVDLFTPHEMPYYNDTPDVENVLFYIPNLLKAENMNSPDLEMDTMYMSENDARPFIECSKKDELPIQTKVVVYLEETVARYFVDMKAVVNGAGGQMLLRQYLAPVLESESEDI